MSIVDFDSATKNDLCDAMIARGADPAECCFGSMDETEKGYADMFDEDFYDPFFIN